MSVPGKVEGRRRCGLRLSCLISGMLWGDHRKSHLQFWRALQRPLGDPARFEDRRAWWVLPLHLMGKEKLPSGKCPEHPPTPGRPLDTLTASLPSFPAVHRQPLFSTWCISGSNSTAHISSGAEQFQNKFKQQQTRRICF